jgi:hypothetical protein
VPNYRDRFNLMGFVSDKLALMDFVHGDIKRREPAADALERLAGYLAGATSVRRLSRPLPSRNRDRKRATPKPRRCSRFSVATRPRSA